MFGIDFYGCCKSRSEAIHGKLYQTLKLFGCSEILFSQRVVNRWNKLDQRDTDSGSINGVKNRLEGIWEDKDRLLHGIVPPSLAAS